MNDQSLDTSEEQARLRRDQRLQQAKVEYEKAERWHSYWYAGLFLFSPIAIWGLLQAFVVGLFPVDRGNLAVSIIVAAVALVAGSTFTSLVTSGNRKRRDQAREVLERITKKPED